MNAYHGCFPEHEKLNNLSDLVNNWSIAPPAPHLSSPVACTSSLGTPMARYLEPSLSQVKHDASTSSPYPGNVDGAGDGGFGLLPSHGHQMKRERLHQDFGVGSEPSLLRPLSGHTSGYHIGLRNPLVGVNKYCSGVPDAPWSTTTRSFSDLVSFGGCLSKPLIDFRGSKSSVRSSASADSRKQGHHDQTSPSVSQKFPSSSFSYISPMVLFKVKTI